MIAVTVCLGCPAPAVLVGRLKDNEVAKVTNDRRPGRLLLQVGCLAPHYYVAGPVAWQYDMVVMFEVGLASGLTPEAAVSLFNEGLCNAGYSPDAQVFVCSSRADAVRTVEALILAA